MKTYELHLCKQPSGFASESRAGDQLASVPQGQTIISVNTFPWSCEYQPETEATLSIVRNDSDQIIALQVYMRTNEWPLRAHITDENGPVHTDSCMEFFLMPTPHISSKYTNIEINPLGATKFGIGEGRGSRQNLDLGNYRTNLNIESKISPAGWELSYVIPLEILKQNFGEFELLPGYEMRANFYKCGDNTIHPHYGCWSEIDLPAPDFHCPNFFGRIVCR